MKYSSRKNKRGGMNRTQKNYGENRKSLFDTIGTSAKTAIKNTASFIQDKGARFFGYQKINQDQDNNQMASDISPEATEVLPQASEMSQKAYELSNTASNVASGLLTKANQIGSIVVDELNKNIEGPIKSSVSASLEKTVEAAKDVLQTANEKLNNPEFVDEVAKTAQTASELAATVLEASEPALNEAIDKTSEIGAKVASKVGESAVSVALNTAEAIPGPGALVGLVRDVDKLATAGEAIIEAGAETATTFVDTLKKAEDAIKTKMEEASSINNRVNDGINQFNNVDNISKRLGVKNPTYSELSHYKKGGRPSKKFIKAKRRLTRRLRFKKPVSSSM
jgi:hypothetical protein